MSKNEKTLAASKRLLDYISSTAHPEADAAGEGGAVTPQAAPETAMHVRNAGAAASGPDAPAAAPGPRVSRTEPRHGEAAGEASFFPDLMPKAEGEKSAPAELDPRGVIPTWHASANPFDFLAMPEKNPEASREAASVPPPRRKEPSAVMPLFGGVPEAGVQQATAASPFPSVEAGGKPEVRQAAEIPEKPAAGASAGEPLPAEDGLKAVGTTAPSGARLPDDPEGAAPSHSLVRPPRRQSALSIPSSEDEESGIPDEDIERGTERQNGPRMQRSDDSRWRQKYKAFKKTFVQSISGHGTSSRDRLAIVFGLGGMMLARSSFMARPEITDLRFFPLASIEKGSREELLAEAGRILRAYFQEERNAKGLRLNMFLPVGTRSQDFIIDLPDALSDEALDSVALLTALEQKQFNAEEVYFDYRSVAPIASGRGKERRTRYYALAAPIEAVDTFLEEVAGAGIPITGLTSRNFGATSLVQLGWLPRPAWRNFIAIFVGEESTIVALMVGGLPVTRRRLRYGIVDMFELMAERGPEASPMSERHPLAGVERSIRRKLCRRNLTDREYRHLGYVLEEAVDRIASFVHRISYYHVFNDASTSFEGIYVVAPDTVGELLKERFERDDGLSVVRSPLLAGEMSPHARAAAESLHEEGFAGLAGDAVGLALAARAVPNLIDRAPIRRRRHHEQRLAAGLVLFLSAVGFAALLATAANVWQYAQLVEERARLEATLPEPARRLSIADVRSSLMKLEGVITRANDVAQKRGIVLALSELDAFVRDGVHFTGVSIEQGAAKTDGGRTQTPVNTRTVRVSGIVLGTRPQRQTLLTELMRDVRRNPSIGDLTGFEGGKEDDRSQAFTLTFTRRMK